MTSTPKSPLLSQITSALCVAQDAGLDQMDPDDIANLSRMLLQYAQKRGQRRDIVQDDGLHESSPRRFRKLIFNNDEINSLTMNCFVTFGNSIVHSSSVHAYTQDGKVDKNFLVSTAQAVSEAITFAFDRADREQSIGENLQSRGSRSIFARIPQEKFPEIDQKNYANMSLDELWDDLDKKYQDFDSEIADSEINWGYSEAQ